MSTPVGSGYRSTSQTPQAHNIYKDPQSGLEFQMRPDQALAPLVEDVSRVPEGMAVIILHYGDQDGDMTPQPVTCVEDTVYVPRNSKRAISMGHLDVLLGCVENKSFQPRVGAQMVSFEKNRFNLQILKLPKSVSKDLKENLEQTHVKAERQRVEIA
tara:strand:+ start:738 stop:1208 length:471 start_codon:yes stop_codon:yes gene_type:complete